MTADHSQSEKRMLHACLQTQVLQIKDVILVSPSTRHSSFTILMFFMLFTMQKLMQRKKPVSVEPVSRSRLNSLMKYDDDDLVAQTDSCCASKSLDHQTTTDERRGWSVRVACACIPSDRTIQFRCPN